MSRDDAETENGLLERTHVHRGRVVDLWVERVRLPNGVETELEVVRHTGASVVVPVTDRRTVLLVRQYRHASGGWLLEAPAGTLEGGTEDPEACAHRELEEEAGVRAGKLTALGWIWTTPGFTDEKIWLYLATELSAAEQQLEEDEVLQIEELPLERALEGVHSGEIVDAKTICALVRAARHLNI